MSRHIATLLLRIATAANFLSPVAGRLGLWGNADSSWSDFVNYTARLNAYAPKAMIPVLAVIVTILEVFIAILLLIGYKIRLAAIAAASLTLIFAIAMTCAGDIKDVLDYAVLVDITSAFLLSTILTHRYSLDYSVSHQ